jgi:hypothetical protein
MAIMGLTAGILIFVRHSLNLSKKTNRPAHIHTTVERNLTRLSPASKNPAQAKLGRGNLESKK